MPNDFNNSESRTHFHNFLKCACCGKLKVDTEEDFYVNFSMDNKSKYWLCSKCNGAKRVFDRADKNLVFIIGSGRTDKEEYAIYTRKSVYM